MRDKNTPKERPIDPTKNAQDIIADTTGLTGITTSSPQEGGAEPEEKVPDSSNLPGTVVNEPNAQPTYGIPKEATSNKVYQKDLVKGESEEEAKRSEDLAIGKSAVENFPQPRTDITPQDTLEGAQTIASDENAVPSSNMLETGTDTDPLTSGQGEFKRSESPDEAGEQSVSGDMPTPDSDDDTLANAQAVGTQQAEDPEYPEELDIGRDIDEAEEEILES